MIMQASFIKHVVLTIQLWYIKSAQNTAFEKHSLYLSKWRSSYNTLKLSSPSDCLIVCERKTESRGNGAQVQEFDWHLFAPQDKIPN